MLRSPAPVTRLACVVVVSVLSAGCLSAALQPLSGPSGPLSLDSPSVPATTTDAPATPPSPFAGQSELHLETLRQAVLQRNPSLVAMQSAWHAAIERYPQVTALDDPTFSYGLAPATIAASRLDLGQKFELSQRLPWPGTLRLRGEAARSDARAAGEDLNATSLRLVEATDHAFYDHYFVHRALDINRVNQALLLEFQRLTEIRYGAGIVSKQDALQAEVDYQRLVHRRMVLERIRDVTVARLNTLLNLPPESFLPPPPRDLPGVKSLPPIAMLHTTAEQHQPELHALALKIDARSVDVKLAQLDYFPNLSVSGGYNSRWQEDDLRPSIGVGLNFPLQLGRRKAALREARAKEAQARARFEEHRARVLFDVSQASENVQENAHVARLYAGSIVPAAEENLTAARSDYETGLTDFVTLITAEKALMMAELSYEQALANYHKGRAQLERAIGVPLEHVEAKP